MTLRTLRGEARERFRRKVKQNDGLGSGGVTAIRSAPVPGAVPQEFVLGRASARRAEREPTAGEAMLRACVLPPAPTKLQQCDLSLTDDVQALYEESVMPVREIAMMVGVNERTLYRYVEKGGWKRRYPVRGVEAAAANRGRPWKRPPGYAQPKGAGGRFIAKDEVGQPQASGLKALDSRGAAMVSAQCQRAAELSDDALAYIRARRITAENAKTLLMMAKMTKEMLERARGRTRSAAKTRQVTPRLNPLPQEPVLGRASARPGEERKQTAGVATEWPLGMRTSEMNSQPVSAPPAPKTEQERRINAIAAKFYALRRGN